MENRAPKGVGGVDDDALAAVVGMLPGLPNIGAEPADRFAQAVRALVENRAQRGWLGEVDEDVAVFVMVDHPRRIGVRYEARPFTDPIATRERLLGRLFFANRDASSGRFMALPTEPNEILEWLEDEKLGGYTVVSVYRESKRMFTRREGAGGATRTERIRDSEPTATVEELAEALEQFHNEWLLTPACGGKGVWERGRAGEYVPGSEPEKSVQSGLQLFLSSWFHGVVRAEREDKTNIGRIDIRLLKRSKEEGTLAYWVIMELKVIKSFANAKIGSKPAKVGGGANIEAIVKGIRQAGAYRKNREAEEGLLEVYDLRKDKIEDLRQRTEVRAAVVEFFPPVAVRVWPVYGSSEDARAAGYTGV